MIYRGSGAGLAEEALPEARILRQHRVEDLECDLAVEPEVVRAVDDGHPAAAYLLVEPVPGDPRPGRDGAIWPRGLVTHHASSSRLSLMHPTALLPGVCALHSARYRSIGAETFSIGHSGHVYRPGLGKVRETPAVLDTKSGYITSR